MAIRKLTTRTVQSDLSLVRQTIRPSMNMDFVNSQTVDGRVSFSRSSAATYFGKDGFMKTAPVNRPRVDFNPVTGECLGLLIEEARTNICTGATSFATGWVSDTSDVVYRGNGTSFLAPDGTYTATALIENDNSGQHRLYRIINASASTSYTISAFFKAGIRSTVNINIDNSALGGAGASCNANLSTGTITAISGNQATGSIKNVGNGWYRVALTFTTGTVGSAFELRIQGVDPSSTDPNGINFYTGSALNPAFYVWGAQIEANSTQYRGMTSFIPSVDVFLNRSTTATYHDTTGVVRTSAVGRVRKNYVYDGYEYVFASGGVEGQSTNLISSSNSWVSYNGATITGSQSDPTGSSSANRIVANTGSNAFASNGTYTCTAGQYYSYSVYVRPQTCSEFRVVMAASAASPQAEVSFSVTSGLITSGSKISGTFYYDVYRINASWYRVTVTWKQPTTQGIITRVYGDNASGTLDIFGAQLENSSVPTSYIPTSGSQITRSAEEVTWNTGSRSSDEAKINYHVYKDYISELDFSAAAEYQINNLPTTDNVVGIFDIGEVAINPNRLQMRVDPNGRIQWISSNSNASGNQFNILSVDSTVSARHKTAISLSPNYTASVHDGVFVGEDTSFSSPDKQPLYIGRLSLSSGNHINGYIRSLKLYGTALSNEQLSNLTLA